MNTLTVIEFRHNHSDYVRTSRFANIYDSVYENIGSLSTPTRPHDDAYQCKASNSPYGVTPSQFGNGTAYTRTWILSASEALRISRTATRVEEDVEHDYDYSPVDLSKYDIEIED